MTPKQIKTAEEFAAVFTEIGENKDFFIRLNGGIRSSKSIQWLKAGKNVLHNKYRIENEIDDSQRTLLLKTILTNRNATNIGVAMEKGAFYYDEG